MNSDMLKQEIRKAAFTYAKRCNLPIDESYKSAVIFQNLADNFHPVSFANIVSHAEWYCRTSKAHQNVTGALEMQSSNSSDALLMNIFCHPSIQSWAGVKKVLGNDIDSIAFGFPGEVQINKGQQDSTEIDMALPGLFCEAKLTEYDFTQKRPAVVENYDSLRAAFHVEVLPRVGDEYDNYQIIRNLLAAIEHDRGHILLCDERRTDLIRRYLETVSCLRDVTIRKKCRVIFWQEVIAACNKSLREWIKEKYGIN